MKKVFICIWKTVRDWFKTNIERIWISVDVGILLMGIFLCWFDTYMKSSGEVTDGFRTSLGSFCIVLFFFLFPFITADKKEKILIKITLYSLTSLLMLFLLVVELEYLLKNLNGGSAGGEILFCICGIIIFTYICYVFIGVVKGFLYLFEKSRNYIFTKAGQEVSGVIKMIEAITAVIASITALGTSIAGILALVNQIK